MIDSTYQILFRIVVALMMAVLPIKAYMIYVNIGSIMYFVELLSVDLVVIGGDYNMSMAVCSW